VSDRAIDVPDCTIAKPDGVRVDFGAGNLGMGASECFEGAEQAAATIDTAIDQMIVDIFAVVDPGPFDLTICTADVIQGRTSWPSTSLR